ncbi:hypothetical protein CSB20_10755 [bacterium DOLZORAL124_64_63]|nr:MAG: hypothetical protein CSB20_10755 [bacterium DOLZORAL124_64_63]
MKKFAYVIVVALAMTALISTAALAGDGKKCSLKDKAACTETAKAQCPEAAKAHGQSMENLGHMMKAPGKCCVKAAVAGKGCCGHDAKTVAAMVADYNAGQAALKGMNKCCAEAVVAGKGCCGRDAKALKAIFMEKVAVVKTDAKSSCVATCGAKAAAGCETKKAACDVKKAACDTKKAACDTKKSCDTKKTSLKEHASNR